MDSSLNIDPNALAAAAIPKRNRKKLAYEDFARGLSQWRIWFLLAYQDIKLRYRRSILGPFWITLSMAITVYSMGFLYAHLFKTDMRQYYPFLVAGMLGWSLISGVIIELTDTFIVADGLIKQIKLPYSLYIHRVATRNVIIFFHNLLVMIPVLIIFHDSIKVNFYSLMLLPNLALIYTNIFTFGMILAIIGARYRDISQIIKSLIQVAFFVTPVMWNPIVLPPQYQNLMYLNPFYIFVELLRSPLVGAPTSALIGGIALLITALGAATCAFLFTRYRARIIYWL
jgi:lipopolysaccharide transport system permease protein